MTSVSARSHVSAIKILTLPPGARRLTDAQTLAAMKKALEEEQRIAQRIREEGPRRLAEQDAVEVHTVFKVDGRVVGIIHRSGRSTFASNGAGAGIAGVHETAARLGRTGEALNDMLADHSAKTLRSLYGGRLQVENYPDGANAPTSGEVEDMMFGRASGARRLSQVV